MRELVSTELMGLANELKGFNIKQMRHLGRIEFQEIRTF
jgi:hypothetical protein